MSKLEEAGDPAPVDGEREGQKEEVAPPPYETILNIPDWTDVPPPPSYDAPIIQGVPEGILLRVYLFSYCYGNCIYRN